MVERSDFLVVGSGLAGLTFALKAATHGTVTVLTKADLSESNTNYAQGGIAAAVGESDSWELHEEDTLRAGAGLCDREAVRFLVQRAPEAIRWLEAMGTRFDRDLENELSLHREGGHSRHRIVHHADRTGWEVERAVTAAVRAHPGIRVYEDALATELLVHDGRCVGAAARVNEVGMRAFSARATMLATGGCGKVYQHTTNPRVATGDGLALAARAGAKLAQLEFIQFHPTTLSHPQVRGFLITEAVRGAGGLLRNHMGRRFMYDYDPRLELAPRDVVARAIHAEMRRLDTWCVYLDTTHLSPKRLEESFPTIWAQLREVGIEIEKDWIPVVPAQHYSCGGVSTDLDGRTTLPGLYAAGEVACTMVHGANRLASNSLLEAIVFAASASERCLDEPEVEFGGPEPSEPKCVPESDAVRIRHALQKTMTQQAGIVRTTGGLREAHERIEGWKMELDRLPSAPWSPYAFETSNLLLVGEGIVAGALDRRFNVGLHYNLDLVSVPTPPDVADAQSLSPSTAD